MYLYFWCYETPRVNRAPGARGGSRVFPHEGPTLGGACWLSKTCRAKKKSEIPWRYGSRRAGSSYEPGSRRLLSCNTRVKNGDFGLSLRGKKSGKSPTPGPMSPLGCAQLSLPPWLLSLRPSCSGGRRRGVRGSNARGSGEEGGCHLDFRPLFCLAVYCEQQAIKLTCIAFGCEIRHSTSS